MRIYISGPMGSGKSSVAAHVGTRAGLEVFDLDAEIERRSARSVTEIFAELGEPEFRRLEAETLEDLLSRHPAGVFALGGGTVTNGPLRHRLLFDGIVVTLEAPAAELARRVGSGQGRPLLAGGDPEATLAELLARRAAAYAECHGRVATSGRSLDDIAQDVVALAKDAPIAVPLGERTYRVLVGQGVRARAGALAAGLGRSARVLLVSDSHVAPLWADELEASLRAAELDVVRAVVDAGEENKTIESVTRIWDAALDGGVDRGGAVITLGGGVVGDLGGFAASTLLRGVPVGHVATTLLAMADSAVGGKTGFDTRHGKNLVGSFHQPGFVLCDVEVLRTLPLQERRAGLAEVVKSAWLAGEGAVAALERDAAALAGGDPAATTAALRMAAGLKACVVTEDEREAGSRALLNLGHTVGHAIEAAQGYSGLRHGEAVALGMVAAFDVAAHLGVEGSAFHRQRMVALLTALGLPTGVGPMLQPSTLSYIGADKKRRGGEITFVVPGAPGKVELRPLPVAELLDVLGRLYTA